MDPELKRYTLAVFDAIQKRVVESDGRGVKIDNAGWDALAAIPQAFKEGRERQMRFFFEIILELLDELPVPTASGVLMAEMDRRSGLDRS